MSVDKRSEDGFPIRYSTCAYFDVYAFSDAEHERVCEEIRKLINSHPLVNHTNVQEV